MANTQAMCTSFKNEILQAYHNFSILNPVRVASTADTFYGALYASTATINSTTTIYTTSGQATGTGYTAGGLPFTQTNPTSGQWTPPQLQWTGVTLTSVDALLVYNSSQGNRAVSVHTFGAVTLTNGTFTLTMPVSGGLISIT